MLQRKVGQSSLPHVSWSWFKLMVFVEISNRTEKLYYCYLCKHKLKRLGKFWTPSVLSPNTDADGLYCELNRSLLCRLSYCSSCLLSFLLIERTISFMPLQSFVSLQTCSSPRPLGWIIIYGFPVRSFFVLCTGQEDEQKVQDLQRISYVCSGTK